MVTGSSDIAEQMLLCEQHLVLFCRVNSHVEFQHVLNLANKGCEDLLYHAAILGRKKGGTLHELFHMSGKFWHQKLGKSV
jgi:hypothetical protein